MSGETELERMVVRLIGDVNGYVRPLRQAADQTAATAAQLQQRMDRAGAEVAGQFNRMGTSASQMSAQVGNSTAQAAQAANNLTPAVQAVNRELDKMAVTAMAAGAAMIASTNGMLRSSVMLAGQYEQSTIAFETMLGSAEEASAMLADLTKFAADTPFEMAEIEKAARGLVTFGERGEELQRTLVFLGNAASGTGTRFGELAQIYNQVRGVGKLLTEDFRQMSTRGIVFMQDFADHFGVAVGEIQGMMSRGEISFEDLREVLQKLSAEGGRFNNLMQRQSRSTLGLLSTLSDNAAILRREIGQELEPVTKRLIDTIAGLVQQFRDLPGWVKAAAGGVLILTTAAGGLLIVGGGVILVYRNLIAVSLQYITASRGVAASNAVTSTSFIGLSYSAGAATAATTGLTLRTVALRAGLVGLAAYGIAEVSRAFANGSDAVKQYDQALEGTRKNTESLLGLYKQQEETILGRAAATADPAARRQLLATEIEKATRKVTQYKDEVRALEKSVEAVNTRWKRWTDDPALRGQQESLAQSKRLLDQMQERVTKLNNEMRKIKLPSEDPALLKDIKELDESLAKQRAAMRMSSDETKIYEMSLKGAGDQMLRLVRVQAELNRTMKDWNSLADRAQDLDKTLRADLDLFGLKGTDKTIGEVEYKLKEMVNNWNSYWRTTVKGSNPLIGDVAPRTAAELDKAIATTKAKGAELEAAYANLKKNLEEVVARPVGKDGFGTEELKRQTIKSLTDASKTLTDTLQDTQEAAQRLTAARDALGRLGETRDALARARETAKLIKREEELAGLMEDGRRLQEQMRTPAEQYRDTVAKLEKMLARGAISEETFSRAMTDARKKLDEAAAATRKARLELERFDAVLTGSAEDKFRLEQYRMNLQRISPPSAALPLLPAVPAEAAPAPRRVPLRFDRFPGGPILPPDGVPMGAAAPFGEIDEGREKVVKLLANIDATLNKIAAKPGVELTGARIG